ncbi:MAG TPA: hypothetical protein DDW52_06070, partial [Planctomycetaceae bacterium]|nr:hypothetical protein [Planctomycetaceae bacterium]
ITMDATRAAREYRMWVQAIDDSAAEAADVRKRMGRLTELTDAVHHHVYSSHSLFCKVLAQQTTAEQKVQLKEGYYEWICEHVAELDDETKLILTGLLDSHHRTCWLGLTAEQYASSALKAIPQEELAANFSKRQAHIIRVFAERILGAR